MKLLQIVFSLNSISNAYQKQYIAMLFDTNAFVNFHRVRL